MPISNLPSRLAAVGLAAGLLALWFYPGPVVDENAAPEAPTPIVVNRTTVSTAELFRTIDQRIDDSLGLSGASVQLIGTGLTTLGFSPSQQVIMWPGSRPYLADDFTATCLTPQVGAETRRLIDSTQARLAADGTYFLFSVTPDKTTVEREALGPLRDAYGACADLNLSFLETLGAEGEAGEAPVLTAFDEFADAREPGEYLFRFGDSHWNFHGASLFAGLVLDRLERDGQAPAGLVKPTDLVDKGPQELRGDLFTLMGVERTDEAEVVVTERQGVTTTHETEQSTDGWVTQRWQSTATSESTPFITGRTLVLHDSMFAYNSAVYAPYFEDLTSVPLQAVTDPGSIALLGDYDRVIVQEVQRSIPAALAQIEAARWF